MRLQNFFAELKRRNVYKVAVAYAVVAWLLVQVATQVFPFLEIPNWVVRLVIALVVIGFPIALVIAWAFEVTPEGIKRTEIADAMPAAKGQKKHAWIFIVVVAAAISVALFFLGRYTAGRKIETPNEIANKSIAVLPFENFSEDKAFAFFADGVQDEILTDLAKIADLKVISRTSVMQYKEDTGRNVPEIAQALKVAHVLEGSVQRSGNRVRVSAQLIDARNDTHIWAEKYDRDLADVFAIQSEIAQAIADQLQAKLSPKEKSAINERPTSDLAAHDLYLRAKELIFTGDRITAQQAVEYGLANRVVPAGEVMDEARKLAQKLLAQPRNALRQTKIIMNTYLRQSAAQVLDTTLASQLSATLSDEHQVLARAFLDGQKRKS